LYAELKDKNFVIVSVAEDTGGAKAAGPAINAAKPEYPVLIDPQHTVTRLYNLVNVPTAMWINEKGLLVRPPEVAYVDNRLQFLHRVDAGPYIEGLRDWVSNGEKSRFVLSEKELKEQMPPQNPDQGLAAAEFGLAEYLYRTNRGKDAIGHYKESQRLNPDSWNFKRQAWALADPDKDYGTNFLKEVQKLGTKPYYAPRQLPEEKK
jgi:hypothetical protein